MRLAGAQRKHAVVVGARLVDVRQVRQEEAEVHDISPRVWLERIHGKSADTQLAQFERAATDCLAASLG
ncbi:hypothetical protein GCM10027093_63460 [Paraburkholderia jirisanensis]